MVVPTPAEIHYQLTHIREDRSFNIIVSHAICLPIAVIAVALRLISRRLIKASIQADDWSILFALSCFAGQITGGLLSVRFGGGKHAVLLKDPVLFAKLVIAIEVIYTLAIAAVKLSVLLLYRRLFPNRRFQTTLWLVGAFIFCYTTIGILVCIFECQPVEAAWEPFMEGNCIQLSTETMFMACMNVLTDFVTLLLPMPLLWGLQISKVRKLQLMGIFLTGGVVCILSIYRVPKVAGLSLSDASWSDVDSCIWSVAEVCVGIVGACLPTLRPLFNRSGRSSPDRSPEDVPSGYSYGAKTSRGTPWKQVQTTITAAKLSRSRSGDGRPLIQLATMSDTRTHR